MCTRDHMMCMVVHMAPLLDAIDPSTVDDLHRRLNHTRAARLPSGNGWERGTDPVALAALLRRWRREFDPAAFERRVRALPWAQAGPLRVLHQPATPSSPSTGDAPTVVLLHGWPDSVLRYERVLPLLRDVTVVVPALPGFPFAADDAARDRTTVATIAADVGAALRALGYERYVVSGGDIGADIAEHLATIEPDRVAALHLTNISPLHAVTADPTELDDEGLEYLGVVGRWARTEGAYIALQSTRPHTLAAGLADSPAGLAAWLLEKLHGWTDVPFDDDDLLTWISAYWFTTAIGTSFATYTEPVAPAPYVATPTMLSTFAHDTKPAPRGFASRFVNVQAHAEHDQGGHFAAWEVPEVFVADLRTAIDLGFPAGATRPAPDRPTGAHRHR